jgi:hypothetical protein
MLRDNPDSKDPDIRQNRRGKFMPKILKLTAALELHSCGCSIHFLLELTTESSSHSSPVRFHSVQCIEIRDSRDVHFICFSTFSHLNTGILLFISLHRLDVTSFRNACSIMDKSELSCVN